MKHFNIEIRDNEYLTRENYLQKIIFEDVKEKESYLAWYDKHIQFFNDLSTEEFNFQIEKLLKKFKDFKQITNLNDCDFSGIYIMVLDKHKQLYIGVSKNIKKRIKQHWSKNVKLDYLSNWLNNFPIGIDCFKALDTTRIYVSNYNDLINYVNLILENLKEKPYKQNEIYFLMEDDEAKMIKLINKKFLCNKYIRTKLQSIKRF